MLERLTPPGGERRYTALWLAWIAAFFAIELPPVHFRHSVDTLSDHVWFWFGIRRRTPPLKQLRARRLALMFFMAWLSAHFLTGDDV
jgi:hypothetical protein